MQLKFAAMQFVKWRRTLKELIAFEKALDVNIIMSVTDFKGTILAVNKKFCEVSQCTEEELVGKSHNVINSGYHNKAFFSDMWQTIRNGHVWKGEIKNKTKNGNYYWVDTVIVPVVDVRDGIQQFLSLRVVVTGRKEAELTLERAIFALSHKVRQPLVNMQALVTLCKTENISDEEFDQVTNYMQHELDRMDDLTRHLALDLHNYKATGKTGSSNSLAEEAYTPT